MGLRIGIGKEEEWPDIGAVRPGPRLPAGAGRGRGRDRRPAPAGAGLQWAALAGVRSGVARPGRPPDGRRLRRPAHGEPRGGPAAGGGRGVQPPGRGGCHGNRIKRQKREGPKQTSSSRTSTPFPGASGRGVVPASTLSFPRCVCGGSSSASLLCFKRGFPDKQTHVRDGTNHFLSARVNALHHRINCPSRPLICSPTASTVLIMPWCPRHDLVKVRQRVEVTLTSSRVLCAVIVAQFGGKFLWATPGLEL